MVKIQQLEHSREHIPPLRRDLNKLVRDYCDYEMKSKLYGEAWNYLYQKFKERFNIDLPALARKEAKRTKKKVRTLDVACSIPVEEFGMDLMVELYALARLLFDGPRTTQQPKKVVEC